MKELKAMYFITSLQEKGEENEPYRYLNWKIKVYEP